MEATIVKKYNLDNEDIKALKKVKDIVVALNYEGFDTEFSDNEGVILDDITIGLDCILNNDGEDWME